MAIKQTFVEPPKVKIVATLPSLADVEDGEIFYDATNSKLALKTTEGWKYWTQD